MPRLAPASVPALAHEQPSQRAARSWIRALVFRLVPSPLMARALRQSAPLCSLASGNARLPRLRGPTPSQRFLLAQCPAQADRSGSAAVHAGQPATLLAQNPRLLLLLFRPSMLPPLGHLKGV